MTPDDDIIRLARRLVDRLTDWAALQAPIERQPSIRAYYESKGPIYRQLSQRLLMARKNRLRQCRRRSETIDISPVSAAHQR